MLTCSLRLNVILISKHTNPFQKVRIVSVMPIQCLHENVLHALNATMLFHIQIKTIQLMYTTDAKTGKQITDVSIEGVCLQETKCPYWRRDNRLSVDRG